MPQAAKEAQSWGHSLAICSPGQAEAQFKEGTTFWGRLKNIAHIAVQKAFQDKLNLLEDFESQTDLKYAVEQNVGNRLLKENLWTEKDHMVSILPYYPILCLILLF